MIYEIRDGEGKVLRKCHALLEARLASLDYPDGSVIVERRFVDGEWEEREMYVRLKNHPCYKEQPNDQEA